MQTAIKDIAKSTADSFGAPLYLYIPDLIEQRVELVRKACSGMGIRYAVKTNPNPWLLDWFRSRIESLDVSSSGELDLGLQQGWKPADIEFTGPAKTVADLRKAVEAGVGSIVVEDLSELRLLNEVAGELQQQVRFLVRIAPRQAESGFGVRLAGRVTQFGVDEEDLPDFIAAAKAMKNVRLDGFHIYSGSQCLDDEVMAAHFESMWTLFQQAIRLYGEPVSELVFGAGMGIPYHEGDETLTLDGLAPVTGRIMAEIAALDFKVKAFVEVGRFLVGEAGFFITRVIRVKSSMGKPVVICDGGMNHNLGACGHLGGVSHRHYKMALIKTTSAPSEETFNYRIVGPLCTAIDTLALNIRLPEVIEGDLIAVSCSGSYGPTSSPLFFISHAQPREVVHSLDGKLAKDITWLPGADKML